MLAIELAAYLDRVRPRRILEVGSGYSTTILAAYAAHHDAEVVTLEHEAKYWWLTARALRRLGIDRPVDLRLAPLRKHRFGEHGPYWWYGVHLQGEFDFVLIDGPPMVLGRRGTFFALQGHLRSGWQVWIDDAFRKHERDCLKVWEKEFSGLFRESQANIDGKGVFVLNDAGVAHDHGGQRPAPGQLGIWVFGNGDPNWWWYAQRYLGTQILDSSYVVVVDRGDPPGRPVPKAAERFINALLPADGMLPPRIPEMFGSQAQPRVRRVLYLDDRWFPSTLDAGWLSRGLDIFEDQPDVEQVDLRHLIDVGVAGTGALRPFTASFNGEPSLLRADRLVTASLWTVQLSPGVFRRRDRRAA
jgi:hypothetical protein